MGADAERTDKAGSWFNRGAAPLARALGSGLDGGLLLGFGFPEIDVHIATTSWSWGAVHIEALADERREQMDEAPTVTRDIVQLLNNMTKKIVELSDRVALLEFDKVKKAESDRKRAESYGEISQEISNLLATVNAIGEKPAEVSRAGNGADAQPTPMREAPARITAET
jgi:hypothetical protein